MNGVGARFSHLPGESSESSTSLSSAIDIVPTLVLEEMMLVRARARWVKIKTFVGGWVHERIALDAHIAAAVAARKRTNDMEACWRMCEVMPMERGRGEGAMWRWYHAV